MYAKVTVLWHGQSAPTVYNVPSPRALDAVRIVLHLAGSAVQYSVTEYYRAGVQAASLLAFIRHLANQEDLCE